MSFSPPQYRVALPFQAFVGGMETKIEGLFRLPLKLW